MMRGTKARSEARARRLLAASAVVGLGLLGHAPVAAAADCADAASCFDKGRELYGEERFEESYAAFKKAYELKKSYDIAANLGIVEDKLGKFCDAYEHLSYAQANLPPSLDAEKRASAHAKMGTRLTALRKRVALVRLALKPADAKVTVDGNPSRVDAQLCFQSGKHQVIATLDGHHDLNHTIEAAAGTSETLRMSLVKKKAAPPPADPKPPESDGGASVPLIIAGLAVGAAAAAGGGAMVGIAAGKASDRESLAAGLSGDTSACSPSLGTPPAQCSEIASLSDDEQTMRGAGIGLLAGGGAIMAATVIYAVWPRGDEGDPSKATANVTVLPMASPQSAGVWVGGAF